MKRLIRILIFIFGTQLALVSFFQLSLPIHVYTDFSILYFANKALLHGIHLYDYEKQIELLGLYPELVFTPYPYPPWYALTTLPLGFFHIELAAQMWFLINIGMVATAVWLLVSSWHPLQRLLAILLAITFIPVLGLLVVGQYSLPVLLGLALFLWSVRKESGLGVAFALGFMTFKPHVGLFLILAAVVWLVYFRERAFVRHAMLYTALLAIFMFVVSFLADPAWPLAYIQSINHYRDIPGVQSCGLCASLSVGVIRFLIGEPDLGKSILVSIVAAVGLAGLYFVKFRFMLSVPDKLMSLFALFTLLVYPYLLNYDYVLLLVPLIVLAKNVQSLSGRMALLVAYLLPWGLFFWGRDANFLLSVSSLLLLIVFFKHKTI